MITYLKWIAALTAVLAFFAFADVAYAHDCSSPEDCENVITGTGLIEAILGAAAGAAAAGAAAAKAGAPSKAVGQKAPEVPETPEVLAVQPPNLPPPVSEDTPIDDSCT